MKTGINHLEQFRNKRFFLQFNCMACEVQSTFQDIFEFYPAPIILDYSFQQKRSCRLWVPSRFTSWPKFLYEIPNQGLIFGHKTKTFPLTQVNFFIKPKKQALVFEEHDQMVLWITKGKDSGTNIHNIYIH